MLNVHDKVSSQQRKVKNNEKHVVNNLLVNQGFSFFFFFFRKTDELTRSIVIESNTCNKREIRIY